MTDLEHELRRTLPPQPYNGQRVRVACFPGASSLGEVGKYTVVPEASYEWSSFRQQWDLTSGAEGVEWPKVLRP